MDRLIAVLLLVLVAAVTGVGVVIWNADRHAQDAAEEQTCIARANATATVTLLAPGSSVDKDGRLQAMKVLAAAVDGCGRK